MIGPPLKALLIEDNPGDADLVREHLTAGAGGRVQLALAETLVDGLRRLTEGTFDVLLLDLSLPDANGLAALRAARTACREAPVVVLTGLRDEAVALESLREGAQDYLIKGEIDGPLLVRAMRYATERKRAEEILRRAEARMWETQRTEAVGKLAGSVVHDVNNLMTVVAGFGELVASTFDADDRSRRELVGEMLKAAERAAAVTRQMLSYNRKQPRHPIVLDLNLVVSGMRSMIRAITGPDIELIIDLAPQPFPIKADPLQIEQSLLNLASNARDAMPTSGQLTIQTRSTASVIRTREDMPQFPVGSYVALIVSDNGCGMDEQTKTRAFDLFFTTKDAGRGTGLGLATVQSFVKQSGGEIAIRSERGRGTALYIFLPLAVEAIGFTPPAVPQVSVPGLPGGNETVLVAEDEPAVLTLIRHILERCGYTVLQAISGPDALRVADSHVGTIHLLLTDTSMPEMSGRELASRLKARRPDLSVVYASGFAENIVVEQGTMDADASFLQKPFTLHSLARKVRQVLDAGAPPTAPKA